MRGRMASMTTVRHNAFVRILARINDQIAQSDALLAGPLTDWEVGNVTDELTELKVERLEIETQLQNEKDPPSAH